MANFVQKLKNKFTALLTFSVDNFDYFGQYPEFRILEKKKFSTPLGLIVTCGIMAICLIQLYEQIIDVISRSKPNVVITEFQKINTQEYTLVPQNYTFVFSLVDPYLKTIQGLGTYYKVQVINCARQRIYNETTGQTNIENECVQYAIEECEEDKHFVTPQQKEYFKIFNKSGMYCLDSNLWNTRPIKLQGAAQANVFQYLEIQIQLCTNTSICTTTENISKALQRGFLIIYTTNVLAKMENVNQPYDPIIECQYYSFSYTNSKLILSQLQVLSTYTDIGLIQHSFVNHTSLQQGQISESYEIYNNNYLIQYSIMLYQKTTLYSRSYVKLQTIIGSIGGLWQVLSLMFSIIIAPLITQFAQISLANQLFRFQQSSGSNADKLSQSRQQDLPLSIELDKVEEELPELSSPGRRHIIQQNSQFNNAEIQKILFQNQQKQRTNNIKYTVFHCFRRKNKMQIQLDFAVKQIMNKLDISQVLSKLQEIDKIKSILLTQDQINLFNFIPQPLINQDNSQEQNSFLLNQREYPFLEQQKSNLVKMEQAFISYTNLRRKRKLTTTENLIIKYLDEDIKGLFEKICSQNQRLFHIQISGEHQQNFCDSQSLSRL